MNKPTSMSSNERRVAVTLSLIFAFRMLGIFMILPVFSLYATKLPNITPTLIGLAMGIYGLTQAIFQMPFGILSDKLGRKPIIIVGLLIFSLGSFISGLSSTIDGIIIGRALQGAGAIGSVVIALLADLTREDQRTKAMAIIGTTIGITFSASLFLGPLLNPFIGIPGIFILSGILGLLGIALLLFFVPTPTKITFHSNTETNISLLKSALTNVELLRLDFGILVLHTLLTASFVVLPIALNNFANLKTHHLWLFYLPVLLAAFISMVPMIMIAEKKRRPKQFFIFSIILLVISEIGFWLGMHSVIILGICLYLFFTGFTYLEACLPSLISKLAPAGSKGTAMGVYSSAQFLGIFVGGYLGGWLYEHHHMQAVFVTCAILALLWLVVAKNMK